MKKLTAVILAILILCFAPLANAAKSKDAKAPQFSMLELGNKLSKIILKKYPEAHVSNPGYKVSACNATFAKDVSKGPQSCSDARIQLQPDSMDFNFMLSHRLEYGHYYRAVLKDSVEASDDVPQTIEKRYNIGIISAPKKQPVLSEKYFNSEVPDVPFNHWLYDDWHRLEQAGVPDPTIGPYIPFYKSATRYEFAVAIARLLDKKENRVKDSPKVKAIIADLTFAFEPDLIHLGVPIDHNEMIRDLAEQGIVWQPRYSYLQLDLIYGAKFDKRLRLKMEHVIEKYTAAWLKLNTSSNENSAKG